MHARECIRDDDKAASRLAPKRDDGRFDLYVTVNGRSDCLDLEPPGRHKNRCVGYVGIEHDCGPLEPRRNLREQLKPLASQRGFSTGSDMLTA
jgi:hypothetical protein